MKELRTPAVGYIRMSTDKQEDSPARQRGEIERMAAKGGYVILCWYEDHGLTGTESLNRPEFQRLLKDAAAGKFRAVLMYEQSRFSREDALDAMMHWRLFRDAGVKLVTCQRGEIRFDDLAGLITAIVGQHEARGESIRLAQRSLSGRSMRARQGVHYRAGPVRLRPGDLRRLRRTDSARRLERGVPQATGLEVPDRADGGPAGHRGDPVRLSRGSQRTTIAADRGRPQPARAANREGAHIHHAKDQEDSAESGLCRHPAVRA
jgi:DNA invertase Pin-like site-specific DNA recombinase